MREKEIELLEKQIEKLGSKDFDLEAWKISTILVLERIFGEESPKIAKIQNIHQDLSSWSLRDTLGTSAGYDSSKKFGKEILEACIMELKTLGAPERNVKSTESGTFPSEVLINSLEEELKVSQFKKLKEISKIKKKQERKIQLAKFISGFDSKTQSRILINILGSNEVTRFLQSD